MLYYECIPIIMQKANFKQVLFGSLFCSLVSGGGVQDTIIDYSQQRALLIQQNYHLLLEKIPSLSSDLDFLEKTFIEGVSYYETDDFEKAKKYLTELSNIKEFILHDYTLFYLGKTFYHLTQYKDAVNIYSQLLALYPSFIAKNKIYPFLANSYMKLKTYDQAAEHYKKIYFFSTTEHNKYEALYNSALAYELSGDIKTAVSLYKHVWIQAPTHPLSQSAKEKLLARGGTIYNNDLYEHSTHIPDIAQRLKVLEDLSHELVLKKQSSLRARSEYQIARCYEIMRQDTKAI